MAEVGLFTAFVAGALSISSPCVLPLVPLYLAYLAGTGTDGAPPRQRIVLAHALAFVFGFGLVFVLLGVSLGALGSILLAYRPWLLRVGGMFMIVMGLHHLGLFRLRFLERTHLVALPRTESHSGRLTSSFLVGVGIATGWMPCVGPVLGAIFTLAVGAAEPAKSGALLAAYAAGLAVPFIGVAMAFGRLDNRLRTIGARLNIASGAVVTAVGLLMILGLYQQFFARIVGLAPWTPWEPRL